MFPRRFPDNYGDPSVFYDSYDENQTITTYDEDHFNDSVMFEPLSSPSPLQRKYPPSGLNIPLPSRALNNFQQYDWTNESAYSHMSDNPRNKSILEDNLHSQPGQNALSNAFARSRPPMEMYQNRDSQLDELSNHNLVPVSCLPDEYRQMFKFNAFNAMQSHCFESVVNSDENLVVSAPTGSGKTVLFELAMVRMLMTSPNATKCVYMAPTKALCNEKFADWTAKFQHMGIRCCEFTGDTIGTTSSGLRELAAATIIITTPEKWDSLTRSWGNHETVLGKMQLFLVDEVHILNEGRGSTLEVCISRMKTRGVAVRFILLSATAPNIEDIALWVGQDQASRDPITRERNAAKVFEFGEEYRACRLTKHVHAYSTKNQNDYQFSRNLDYKLFELLQKYGSGKPVLIFCPTRKGTLGTAEQLAKDYKKCADAKGDLPWLPTKLDHPFQDPSLSGLFASGLGIHHAGLSLEDRRQTEDFYLRGQIRVLVATSTLAVGVNLPAHTVVIKGTQMWQGTSWAEYSDVDITQMLGRAGRPQFDTEGVAIIMCSVEREQHYKALTSGQTALESCLHLHLVEHVNSEVTLGTIQDVDSAKTWLRNSFLYQRLQRNPSHYCLDKNKVQSWHSRLDDIVLDAIERLSNTKLIAVTNNGEGQPPILRATEFGEIMSKFYINHNTMTSILGLEEKAGLKDILDLIAAADEFRDIRLRAGERLMYNSLRVHNDIRFTSKKKVESSADKVMVLIQAVLGGIPLNSKVYKTADSQPALDAVGVFRHAARIARAIVDVAVVKKYASQVKHGLEIVRSLSAKAWDDRPIVLRQLPQIGEKSLKILASSGVSSIALLRKQDSHRIELLLNRRPPFGRDLLAEVETLPQFGIHLSEDTVTPSDNGSPVSVSLLIEVRLMTPLPATIGKKAVNPGWAAILTHTSDYRWVDFRRLPVRSLQEPRSFSVNASLEKPSDSLCVCVTSETYAGLSVTETYRPSLAPRFYPTIRTKPRTEMEAEIEAAQALDPSIFHIPDDELAEIEGRTGTIAKEIPANVEGEGQMASFIDETHQKTPEKLLNGHFRCNHPCKDRQACRHLCCKDGALKAPNQRSNKTSKQVDKPMTVITASNGNASTQSKEANEKRARSPIVSQSGLNELRRQSKQRLNAPPGKRLSLPVKHEPKRKRAPISPKFSTLEEPQSEDFDKLLDDDAEELPEIEEAFKASPETDYSDEAMGVLLAGFKTPDFNSPARRKRPLDRNEKNGLSQAGDIPTKKHRAELPRLSSSNVPSIRKSGFNPLFHPELSSSPPRPSPSRSRHPLVERNDPATPKISDYDRAELAELECDPEAAIDDEDRIDSLDEPAFDGASWEAPPLLIREDPPVPVDAPKSTSTQWGSERPITVQEEAHSIPDAYESFLEWIYSGDVEIVD